MPEEKKDSDIPGKKEKRRRGPSEFAEYGEPCRWLQQLARQSASDNTPGATGGV